MSPIAGSDKALTVIGAMNKDAAEAGPLFSARGVVTYETSRDLVRMLAQPLAPVGCTRNRGWRAHCPTTRLVSATHAVDPPGSPSLLRCRRKPPIRVMTAALVARRSGARCLPAGGDVPGQLERRVELGEDQQADAGRTVPLSGGDRRRTRAARISHQEGS